MSPDRQRRRIAIGQLLALPAATAVLGIAAWRVSELPRNEEITKDLEFKDALFERFNQTGIQPIEVEEIVRPKNWRLDLPTTFTPGKAKIAQWMSGFFGPNHVTQVYLPVELPPESDQVNRVVFAMSNDGTPLNFRVENPLGMYKAQVWSFQFESDGSLAKKVLEQGGTFFVADREVTKNREVKLTPVGAFRIEPKPRA